MDKYEDLFQPTFLNIEREKSCDRCQIPSIPADEAVTMAYVPFQQSTIAYDEEKALREGTLYPVLNKRFLGGCKK